MTIIIVVVYIYPATGATVVPPEDEAEVLRAQLTHRHAVVRDPHRVTRAQLKLRLLAVTLVITRNDE